MMSSVKAATTVFLSSCSRRASPVAPNSPCSSAATVAKRLVASSPFGKRLEITRALVTSPKLLLLDEPFSGIDPIAVYEVQKIVRRLKERGLGILVTDHNVRETLKLVDRAYLIHKGEIIYEGGGPEMLDDPKAREIYLGEKFSM